MKKNPKLSPVFLVLAVTVWLVSAAFAQDDSDDAVSSAIFDEDIEYDVTYEVSKYVVERADDVLIIGVVKVANLLFLEVESTGFGKGKRGFIRLDSIRSIIPDRAITIHRYAIPLQQGG